jgi:hypothetical protein
VVLPRIRRGLAQIWCLHGASDLLRSGGDLWPGGGVGSHGGGLRRGDGLTAAFWLAVGLLPCGGWSRVAAPDAAGRRPAGRGGSVRVAMTLLVALPARVGRPLSALVLVGVAMAARPGDGRYLSQRRGGASGSVRAPCWRGLASTRRE